MQTECHRGDEPGVAAARLDLASYGYPYGPRILFPVVVPDVVTSLDASDRIGSSGGSDEWAI